MSPSLADNSEDPSLESDSRFPSGPWRGYFMQQFIEGRSWMDLQLTFREGSIRGEGRDWVGAFLIAGRYELESGKCWWTKKYIGKHDVAYQGYNEGKGIWGLWEIPPQWQGGFHIWPLAMGDPTIQKLSESIEEPQLVGVASGADDAFSTSLDSTPTQ
jgi:hypothetical protein